MGVKGDGDSRGSVDMALKLVGPVSSSNAFMDIEAC